MANCEQQTGFYGLVSRVKSVNCRCGPGIKFNDVNLARWYPLDVLWKMLKSTGRGGDMRDIGGTAVHHVIYDDQINEGDIKWLSSQSKFGLERFFNNLIIADETRVLEVIRNDSFALEKPENKLHTLTRRLSDLLEVLPHGLSAGLLLAVANPYFRKVETMDISQAQKTLNYARDAFVFLPPDARLDIFGEMVQLSPGPNGTARKFLRSVALSNGDAAIPYNELLQLVGT
ncbi:MAG: hypothetical protein PHE48_02480 [Candidatus Daviesbacteria bacterium]|nr:hypothetical protein [Candidatus Daviesbacteria bacterium]